MKKRMVLLLAAALMITAAFSGCGSPAESDFAQTYVQGVLDTLYLGQYNEEFLAITDYESVDELAEDYENGILVETDYFAYYFDVALLTDATRAELADLYKEIYSFSNYQVQPSSGDENAYSVEVTISPIDVMKKVVDEDMDYYLESFQRLYDNGEFDSLTEAEYEDLYAAGIIALIRDRMADIGYLEDQTLTVSLAPSQEDGLYYIQNNGLAQIDEYIIQY